jgi:hypothetical protein
MIYDDTIGAEQCRTIVNTNNPHRGSPDSILRGNSFDRMRLIGSA